ncbi:MAG TPA: DNA-processing protein DprA [Candidatus Paceibacterota bacterium]|nr:DNA-processing protein DprA [Candidatus Paceibacterota bacterium]
MKAASKDDLVLLSPSDFPTLLREIPDAPKQLHVRGTLPSLDKKWIAVVGARACTPYGKQAVDHLIGGLAGYPVVIVSGLAYGIDAEAHKAALKYGLQTVAVPGSGLNWDVLYPKANHGLAREILSAGGALLSEEKPDTRAADWTFPRRNRIMVGLSHATLVIEAKEKSGSLITAKLATEYNRDLLVVPGSIFSDSSRGTHQFLRLGAQAATSAADILQTLGLAESKPAALELRTDLSDTEVRVLNLIVSPLSRDELIRALELPIIEANVLLSAMELKGLIVESLGVVRSI